jgi:hypothetical protein
MPGDAFSSTKSFLSLLFSKQAEIDRKKAEVRARLEAQAGGHTAYVKLF